MNGKLAKRIRYAVQVRGLSTDKPYGSWFHSLKRHPVLDHHVSVSSGPGRASVAKRMVTAFKRAYKAQPYHRRNVPQESHSFVLRTKKHRN